MRTLITFLMVFITMSLNPNTTLSLIKETKIEKKEVIVNELDKFLMF